MATLVPVTLPDGSVVELTGGGQNPLISAIIEDFASRFTPGGAVLYLGDAGDKFVLNRRDAFELLGVTIEEHGPMPDIVIHLPDRQWLVIVEAVTSHGPIGPLRKSQLEALFADSTAGLVLVTAFPDLHTFAKFAADIAWETDVWLADNPSHLIHFDGDRFLGPGV